MPHESPLVSVIVRSMGRTSLPAALATIAAQDHPQIEVIVVAACATPHPELPQSCGSHALYLLRNTTALSRAAAANAGLTAARGDWITFLDDDDAYLPEHLSGLLAARSEAPHAGVLHSWTRVVLADGTIKRNGQPFALMQLYERNIAHLSAALVARAAIERGVCFDESFDIFEDWDYFLQLAHITPFHFVPRQTFIWHADRGDSGAGLNGNHDDAKFAAALEHIVTKWAAPRRDNRPRADVAARRSAISAARRFAGRARGLSRGARHKPERSVGAQPARNGGTRGRAIARGASFAGARRGRPATGSRPRLQSRPALS